MSINRREFLKQISVVSLLGLTPAMGVMANEEQKIKLLLSEQGMDWFGGDYSPIQLWGANSRTIRLKQNVPVIIEVENRLPDKTTLHWHGMRIPNSMDGVSGVTQEPIESGDTFTYRFKPLDAGTFWAHAHHNTYEQLARGLYLPLIVEEQLPYNVDAEFILAIDDWRINQDRQIDIASLGSLRDWGHGGRLGNLITVNRQRNPTFSAQPGQRVRLRILNTANARVMAIKLPAVPSWVIAKDGQPLKTPAKLTSELVLSPAERYDVIIDIPKSSAGEFVIKEVSQENALNIASIVVDSGTATKEALVPPSSLPVNPLSDPGEAAPDHNVKLEMMGGAMGSMREAEYKGEVLGIKELIQKKQIWAFNGVAGRPDKPLLTAKSGDIVEIEMTNNTRWMHGMHLHGHHFKADSERYDTDIWHDTVLMQGREIVKIRFTAGDPGQWLLHCHMIEHQAAGMITWIEVVA